jgi:CDP-4-dehydro-6-deoxyglucose reductase
MVMIYTNYGSSFEQIDQKSMLSSAEKAGVSFPYSCRDGRCSSCKCKILSGQTECLNEELGLTEDQKLQGWVLSCVRTAITDVKLKVEDLGGLQLIKPKTLPCKIASITKMSNEVLRVVLRLPPSSIIEYYAGQYVEVIVGSARRSYSIANSPTTDNRLELHIKKVEQGSMSRYWFEKAKKDDLLRINGPLGTFFLRDIVGKDLVFLATGTGIAPIKAILEALNNKPNNERPDSVTVYWGGRTPNDLYWDLSECQYPVRYEPVLSRPLTSWLGAVGYVQDAFLGRSPDLTKTVVYACGSDTMIRSASDLLFKLGLVEGKFYSDAFVATGPILQHKE